MSHYPMQINSWYLEDEMSELEQPKKEDIQKLCMRLKIPFKRDLVVAILYGDNKIHSERILPYWLCELPK